MFILLSGESKSGKDTLGNYIYDKLINNNTDIKTTKFAIADNLKKVCKELVKLFYGLCLPIEFFHLHDVKDCKVDTHMFNNTPFNIRKILQYVGTDIFQKYLGKDIWLRLLYKKNTLSDAEIMTIIEPLSTIFHNTKYTIDYLFIKIKKILSKISAESIFDENNEYTLNSNKSIFIILDMRFLEEAKHFSQYNTYIVRIIRPQVVRSLPQDTTQHEFGDSPIRNILGLNNHILKTVSYNNLSEIAHISEQEYKNIDCDLEVMNGSTVLALYAYGDVIINNIMKRIN